ncbi:aminotransferase [Crassisporium funariophilum]|nr:aminotransferase [Crassisporium funariophilum]
MNNHEDRQRPYQLLSSTRFDPYLTSLSWNNDSDGPSPFFLLPFHFDRLVAAAGTHSWLYAKSILRYHTFKTICLDAISEQHHRGNLSTAFKIRITVSKDGRIVATASPLTSFTFDPTSVSLQHPSNFFEDEHVLRLYMDKEPISPSVFTSTKTTFRDIYDQAKLRNQSSLDSDTNGSDILLYDDEGYIMEATIFNVAIYRSSKWLTPSSAFGCLPGVMRRWLLENGRIVEDKQQIFTKDSIQNGEWVLLFNGVQGCRPGKIYV